MRWFLLCLIRVYQYGISPVFAPHCRHIPSCSEYAITAIEQHGAIPGGWLALKRLGKCHPWGSSGFDPVPEADNAASHSTHSCNRMR